MTLLMVFTAIVSFACAFRYPYIAIALFMFIGDAAGLSHKVEALMSPLGIAAVIASIVLFRRALRDSDTAGVRERIVILAVVAAALCYWMIISSVYFEDMATMIIGGLGRLYAYATIAGLALLKDKKARYVLTAVVGGHLLLAVLILRGPAFFSHQFAVGGLDQQAFEEQFKAAGLAVRALAQFHNTQLLAFYAGVGVCLGWYLLLFESKPALRAVGAAILCMAVITHLESNTRSMWLTSSFATAVLVMRRAFLARTRQWLPLYVGVAAVTVVGASYAFFVGSSDEMQDRLLQSGRDPNTTYRIIALQRSPKVILENPLFGKHSAQAIANDTGGYVAHQAPVYYAELTGIPAGILITVLLALCVAGMWRWRYGEGSAGFGVHGDRGVGALAFALGCTVLIMSISNQMADGGILIWVCLGMAISPWVYRVRQASPEPLVRIEEVPEPAAAAI